MGGWGWVGGVGWVGGRVDGGIASGAGTDRDRTASSAAEALDLAPLAAASKRIPGSPGSSHALADWQG